ncbi:uncharacterized protein LOC106667891 isoform X2 [Cimex lectularius]|uniref:Uncharacterized protein n=1 Tax=Cimex lectularius TaxID=79782 RepID=A0A8I6RU50_CIMLE|nr:uncharacterized protein LOC106667891 isoform X2 [Cimex lectularius]
MCYKSTSKSCLMFAYVMIGHTCIYIVEFLYFFWTSLNPGWIALFKIMSEFIVIPPSLLLSIVLMFYGFYIVQRHIQYECSLRCDKEQAAIARIKCKDIVTRPTPGGPGHTMRRDSPSKMSFMVPMCKERPGQGYDPARNVIYNLPRVVGPNELRDTSQFICAPLRDTRTGESTIAKRGGVAISKYTQPQYAEGRNLSMNYIPEMEKGCVSLSNPTTKDARSPTSEGGSTGSPNIYLGRIGGSGGSSASPRSPGSRSRLATSSSGTQIIQTKYGGSISRSREDLAGSKRTINFSPSTQGEGEIGRFRTTDRRNAPQAWVPSARQPEVQSPFMRQNERYGAQNYPPQQFPIGEDQPPQLAPVDYPPFTTPHGACTIGTQEQPAYGMVHRISDQCRETMRRPDVLSLGERIKCPPKVFKEAATGGEISMKSKWAQTDKIPVPPPAPPLDPVPPRLSKSDPCVLKAGPINELQGEFKGNRGLPGPDPILGDDTNCLVKRGISEQRLRRVRGANVGFI